MGRKWWGCCWRCKVLLKMVEKCVRDEETRLLRREMMRRGRKEGMEV